MPASRAIRPSLILHWRPLGHLPWRSGTRRQRSEGSVRCRSSCRWGGSQPWSRRRPWPQHQGHWGPGAAVGLHRRADGFFRRFARVCRWRLPAFRRAPGIAVERSCLRLRRLRHHPYRHGSHGGFRSRQETDTKLTPTPVSPPLKRRCRSIVDWGKRWPITEACRS
jgi:hypothetical protein